MTYILYTNGVLEKDGHYLPIDESNPDFVEYLAWRALGNEPEIRPGSEYLAKVEARWIDAENAVVGFNQLPDWSTWTYAEARDGVRSRIFNGWTQQQVDQWIDQTATNAAGIAGVRVALKQVGAAILAIRTILEAMAQAIVFLRDLVVKFR